MRGFAGIPVAAAFALIACGANPGEPIDASSPQITFDVDAATPDAGASPDAGPGDMYDAGEMPPDAGPIDAGSMAPDAGPTPTVTTVQGIVMGGASRPRYAEVQAAVVVAVHQDTSAASEFYIQDLSAAGPGLGVLVGRNDSATVPAVGDIVTVIGAVARRDGILSLASAPQQGIALQVTVTGTGGTAGGGAYPPAGTPIAVASTTAYAHTGTDPAPRRVGNALQFAGPLQVTNSRAFFMTGPDGGQAAVGFEVTGGLWVFDGYVRQSGCLMQVDGGVGSLDLSAGVTGVWDRYEDPRSDGGLSPVLYPMQCSDLNLP